MPRVVPREVQWLEAVPSAPEAPSDVAPLLPPRGASADGATSAWQLFSSVEMGGAVRATNRHPFWATFRRDDLSRMESFGGMLSTELQPCPMSCKRVALSADGLRAVAWGDSLGSAEVLVYDTDSAKVLLRCEPTRELNLCRFTEADNYVYMTGGDTMSVLSTAVTPVSAETHPPAEVDRENVACGGEIFTFALQPLPASNPLPGSRCTHQTSSRSPVVCAMQKERSNGRDDYVLAVFERNADGNYAEVRELVVDAAAGKTFSHHEVIETVAFSPDGAILASAGNDGVLRLWCPQQGSLRRRDGATLKLTDQLNHNIKNISFAGGLPGKKAAPAGGLLFKLTFTTAESAHVHMVSQHPGGFWETTHVQTVSPCAPLLYAGSRFNRDASMLLVRGRNKKRVEVHDVGVLNSSSSEIRCYHTCPGKITSTGWMRDGTSVITFDDQGTVFIFSAEGRGPVRSFLSRFTITPQPEWKMRERAVGPFSPLVRKQASESFDRAVVDFSMCHQGRFIATLHGNPREPAAGAFEVRMWDMLPKASHVEFPWRHHMHRATALNIATAPPDSLATGGMMAACGSQARVAVWDATDLSPDPRFLMGVPADEARQLVDLDDDENNLRALAWSPDGTSLAAAGNGEQVHLWQNLTRTGVGEASQLLEARAFNGIETLSALAWSKGAGPRYLVAVGDGKDPRVMVWCAAAGDGHGAMEALRFRASCPTAEDAPEQADLWLGLGLSVSHLMLEPDPLGGEGAARRLSYLRLDCADFSPQTYNGPELLAVGGETGLWLWQVAEWAHGREGKGTCCSTSLTCNKIQKCKWSADGTKLVMAVENHGVGVLCTTDWCLLWENWGHGVVQPKRDLPPLMAQPNLTEKEKVHGKGRGKKRGRARRIARSTAAEEEVEPLDVVWGTADQTVVVGGRFNGAQGIHIACANTGAVLATIITPRVYSVNLAPTQSSGLHTNDAGIIALHSPMNAGANFAAIWTPYALSGVTPEWEHYRMLRAEMQYFKANGGSCLAHYPELLHQVDHTGNSVLMHALLEMGRPEVGADILEWQQMCADVVKEIIDFAPKDGYCVTVADKDMFYERFGQSQSINTAIYQQSVSFNVAMSLSSALSERKFRHSSRSHYAFWPLVQAMVNQYPAMLMTYLEEGVLPLSTFQWPVPAMLGVTTIAGFLPQVHDCSPVYMWQRLMQEVTLISKSTTLQLKRFWRKHDMMEAEEEVEEEERSPSQAKAPGGRTLATLQRGSIAPAAADAPGKKRSCTLVYRSGQPWYRRLADLIIRAIMRRKQKRAHKVSAGASGAGTPMHDQSTMYNTNYSHSIPMAAFCCQLPGVGAPPHDRHWGLRSEVLGLSMGSQPGDLLRMMLGNDRVPLAAFGTSAVVAATELRWICYGADRLKMELGIHILLLASFNIFAALLPEINEDSDLEGRCLNRIHVLVCCAVIALIWLRSVFTEVRSLLRRGLLQYVKSGWNLLDLAILGLLVAVGVQYASLCQMTERLDVPMPSNIQALLTVSALTSVALWVRILYFLLGFKDTGALVRMVIQIIIDMRFFLLLMVLIAIGFGIGFRLLFYSYILANGLGDGEDGGGWGNWLRIAANMYTIALGDWDTGEFYNGTSDGNFSILLFGLYLLAMVVILLNLLIAIMGDSYDRVKDKEELEFMRGKVKLLMDLESEMETFDLRRHARRADQFVHFMVPSQQVQENEAQEWLGRLRETEKRMRSIVDDSQDKVQETIAGLEAKIDMVLAGTSGPPKKHAPAAASSIASPAVV